MTKLSAATLLALVVSTLTVCTASFAAQVPEAKIGKDIVDRKIVGETTSFALGEKAFLWIRVANGAGETITVTWKVNDLSFPIKLAIGANRWRTSASKTLHRAGEWTVTVTDAAGNLLHEASFSVK